MSLQSKFFTTLVFVLGCILVPLMLTVFFLTQFCFLKPDFWTRTITKAGFVSGYIEENLSKEKKIPAALKRNLNFARNNIESSLKNHLQPQIDQQLTILQAHVNGKAAFPNLRFDLVRLKQDIRQNMEDARQMQSFSDRRMVDLALTALGFAPDMVALQQFIKMQPVKDFIAKNRVWLSFTIQHLYFFPSVVLVFFLLFTLTTLNLRKGLLYFSRLMIFSGLGLAVLCGLGLLVNLFFDPTIKDWLFNNSVVYYDLTLKLSRTTVSNLFQHLLGTICIHGLYAAASSVVIGIIFFTKKKKPVVING